MKSEILLESGINELEIVIFKVGTITLGINVAKVECIVKAYPITKVPHTHKNVSGIINYRGRVIPAIDLFKTLSRESDKAPSERMMILTHINNSDSAFEVSSVVGIKRLSWKEIETPSTVMSSQIETPMTGVVKIENGELILMLDFEKILADIEPSLALKESTVTSGLEGKKVVVAEDSNFLMNVVNQSFLKAGAIVEKFNNWSDALNYLERVNSKDIYCIITDIEMPVMDGLTLTKQIKSNEKIKDIPVVLFSSIVSEDLKHKGVSVGADAQITKPEIDRLISLVTSIGLKRLGKA
ncbi:MAG: chemotaxis protein CheV [Clostridiales bacterium]|nr:chemotaxis protein CheV [Clostridiales bacterium]